MLRARIIPCLQLIEEALVKTIRFKKYCYIGDPVNTVRIFNELEVDELCFLDIRATVEHRQPNLKILREIANECFMPLSYGGGVNNAEIAQKILSIGFEKIIINTSAFDVPDLITQISEQSGNQSVIGSVDVKKNVFGVYRVYTHDGSRLRDINPVEWAQNLEAMGAGELLVTSMDRDGTWSGFEIDIIRKISESVSVPVIANGGAGSVEHMQQAINEGKASAVALGSMVVFQKKNMGILINFPDRSELQKILT